MEAAGGCNVSKLRFFPTLTTLEICDVRIESAEQPWGLSSGTFGSLTITCLCETQTDIASELPAMQAGAQLADTPSTSGRQALEQLGANVLFEKVLTSSDVTTGRRIVIPKAHAEQYLPSCEQPDGVHVTAHDRDNNQYELRLRFWINNSSRMYLLEGTQALQQRHDMQAGDVVVFATMPDGSWLIDARKGTVEDTAKRRIRRQTRMLSGEGRPGTPMDQLSMQAPLTDGVFRAMPDGDQSFAAGKVTIQNGCWTAIVNIAGELYQAFFDSQDAAVVAYCAAAGAEAAY
ncbi:hypothetical protein WJX72_009181 [[Myrmecia] bisecta]|uniref:TF-B3 domain-containing protein n=1 Tax=[Myrmecia] bisecta TaxID=41462 RepID=A0AAW1PGZ0_9CHLO